MDVIIYTCPNLNQTMLVKGSHIIIWSVRFVLCQANKFVMRYQWAIKGQYNAHDKYFVTKMKRQTCHLQFNDYNKHVTNAER